MLLYSLATKLILDTCDLLKTVTQLEFHDVYMKILPASEGFYYAQKFKSTFYGGKIHKNCPNFRSKKKSLSLKAIFEFSHIDLDNLAIWIINCFFSVCQNFDHTIYPPICA